ncbi:MAG: immunoglobulin domain-containing protein, partial [Prosthecobacter sp.]|nr:immunoglobulin domain-containing protein [Prosthecobacter sp.]
MKRLSPVLVCGLLAVFVGLWLAGRQAREGRQVSEPRATPGANLKGTSPNPSGFIVMTPEVPAEQTNVVLPQPPPAQEASSSTLSSGARVIASGWEREKAAAHAAFRGWVAEWVKNGPDAARLARGVGLATARREFLKGLMSTDPRRVLEAAVPFRLRYKLPPEILALIETRVDGTGELSRMAALPVPGQTLKEVAWMEALVSGKDYRVYPTGPQRMRSLGWAALHGVAIDGQLAVTTSPVRAVEAGERFGIDRPLQNVCPVSGLVTAAAAPPTAEVVIEAPADVVDAGDSFVRVCTPEHTGLVETQIAEKERDASPWIEQNAAAGTEGTPEFFANRPAQSWATGVKKELVIRVDFSDIPGEPVTEQAISDTFNFVDGVRDFYERCSFGRSSVQLTPAVGGDSADVTDVFRMPQTAETYAVNGSNGTLHSDARAAATAAGYNMNDYDRIGVCFVYLGNIPGSEIDYGGLGNIEGKNHWLNGYFSSRIISHEIGHNYGLPHSSRQRVANGSTAVAVDGTWEEYGDYLDVMGSGPMPNGQFNMWSKAWLYWLDADGAQVVTASGTYRIGRFDHQNANPGDAALPLALRIPREDGTEYWVGHRRLFTSNVDASNGAYLIWAYDRYRNTRVIDCRTPSDNDASNAPLPVGETFTDTEAGIGFTTIARGGSGVGEWLDVQITFTPRLQAESAVAVVNEASGNGLVMVKRVQSASGVVSADWVTTPGTAVTPQDYTTSSGALNWGDGEVLPRLLSIPLAADALPEGSEEFTIDLSNLSGATMVSGTNPLTVSIRQPGAFDPGFIRDPWINSSVRAVCQDQKGRVIAGGPFYNFGVNSLNQIGRLLPDGTEDTSFVATEINSNSSSYTIYAVAVQSDGKILVGGNFTTASSGPCRLARLNEDGSFDDTFNIGTGPDSTVRAIVIQPDGKILVGGTFADVNGTPRKLLVRLNEDGTGDGTFANTAFTNGFTGSVNAIALQPDGKIVVGGSFATSAVSPFRFSVARLNTDGTADGSFNVGFGAHSIASTSTASTVNAVAVLPNGRIAVGGAFQRFNGTALARNRFVVLSNSGSVDGTYATGFNASVESLLALPHKHLVEGGSFTLTTDAVPVTASYLAAFKPDGSWDADFVATHVVDDDVYALYFDRESGRILAGNSGSTFENSFYTPLFKLLSQVGGTGPVITSQPTGGQLNEGESLTLSVAVNAGQPYCQWYHNGAFIPGATSFSHVITDATSADAGTYVAKIVTAYGMATTDDAVLGVILPPRIDVPPAAVTVNVGQPAGFTVEATGVGMTYQWQKGTADIPGETGTTYSIPVTTADSAGFYRCVVTNVAGSVPTVAAKLTVVSTPQITGHPADLLDFSAGQTATFTVTVDGVNLSYQWQKNEQNLNAQTNATLIMANVTVGHAGSFRCVVTNSAGTAISNPAILTIIGPPTIVAPPQNRIARAGDQVIFSVGMIGLPTTFQWLRNNVAIAGANQKDYTIPAVTAAHAGDYVVKVGPTQKTTAVKLIIITPATDQRAGINGTANFKLTPSLTTGITYQWMAPAGGPLVASTHATGTTKATLTINKCTLSDEGGYSCEATAFTPAQKLTLGPMALDVVELPVVDPAATPPAAIVGGTFAWQIVASQFPTKYAVTGLPSGLVLNTTTGLVSGIPNTAPAAPITL